MDVDKETPPDSAAKIAADLLNVAHHGVAPKVGPFADRVEALGLEPSEREVVRMLHLKLIEVRQLGWPSGVYPGKSACEVMDGWLAALTPIAESGKNETGR